jgi:hypothetical protein
MGTLNDCKNFYRAFEEKSNIPPPINGLLLKPGIEMATKYRTPPKIFLIPLKIAESHRGRCCQAEAEAHEQWPND